MSLILPSATAPAQSASPANTASSRSESQNQDAPTSFGEALARSLAPAADKADKPVPKAATTATARRQADTPDPQDAQDLVSLMTAALTPFENRAFKTALPGSPDSSVEGAATSGKSALPKGLDSALQDSAMASPLDTVNALAATPVPETASPEGADAAIATTLPIAPGLGSPDAAIPDTASSLHPGLADALPAGAAQNLPLAAAASDALAAQNPGTRTVSENVSQAALAALLPAGPKNPAQAQLPTKTNAVAGADPAQAELPDTVPSTQTGRPVLAPRAAQGDKDEKPRFSSSDNAAEPLPAAVPANTAFATPEAGASASPSLPVNLAGAVAPMPGNAPSSVNSSPLANVTTATLAPEVGSNQWGKALGEQVIRMGNAEHQVAELQLNPPGLGPLKVTLSMNEHQMQAMFVSGHASVRAAVEAALPQLRASLAESGISLGNTSVGAESQPQTAFASGQGRQESPSRRDAWRTEEPSSIASASQPARTVSDALRRGQGMRIDTYA